MECELMSEGEVCIPEWVIDDVFRHRRHNVSMLVIAFYRFGSARVIDGERRLYLALPRDGGAQSLVGYAGISEKSVDRAIADLRAMGLLVVHESQTWRRANGYSFPADRPNLIGGQTDPDTRAKLTPYQGQTDPPSDSVSPRARAIARGGGGGGDLSIPPDLRSDLETTTTNAGAHTREGLGPELLADLEELGVSAPEEWLERWGEVAIDHALDRLARSAPAAEWERGWSARLQRAGIRNPAGLLTSWLAGSRREVRR